MYINHHVNQLGNIEKMKKAAYDVLVKLTKEAMVDEELPLEKFTICGMKDQAVVMNTAFPSHTDFYIKGLGATSDGLLTKKKGPTTRVSPTMTAMALEAAQKGVEQSQTTLTRSISNTEKPPRRPRSGFKPSARRRLRHRRRRPHRRRTNLRHLRSLYFVMKCKFVYFVN